MIREPRRLKEVVHELGERVGSASDEALVVRSPLRVCPLGAHIDHQLGRVTGLTLDEAVLLAFAPRPGRVRLWSLDFPGEVAFDLDHTDSPRPGDWGNYPRGAAWVMRETFGIRIGFDGVISGPLPIGGLSSSAAVDVAYLLAFQAVNDLIVAPAENVRLAQRIENEYIGLRNGILDQSIILGARQDALTHLDCLDFRLDHIATPPAARFDIVIAYSGLSRSLVSTDYNRRVAECEEAARQLLELAGRPVTEPPKLRHVLPEAFAAHAAKLPGTLRRRAAHYFGEMARVEAGVAAWAAGDLRTVGRLMTESGASSIDNYECGCPHTTTLYEILNSVPGVWGARFAGAGFRGSVLALASPGARERVVAALANEYPRRHPDVANQYRVCFCAPAGPAEVL